MSSVLNRQRVSGAVGQAAAAGDTGYVVTNSCIFEDNLSTSMTFTPGTPTDASKGVFGTWIKRTNMGEAEQGLISNGTQKFQFHTYAKNDAFMFDAASSCNARTAQWFKDPTGWFHLVLSWDGDDGTAGDRVKLYINGSQVTSWTENNIANCGSAQAFPLTTSGTATKLGDYAGYRGSFYAAQTFCIDGTSIQNSDYAIGDFGEEDSLGNWRPVDIEGAGFTWGDQGWLLDYAVAEGTGNGLGTDVSGEANHFARNNFTASSQTKDSPSDSADDDIGNYCTWNPLFDTSHATSNATSGSFTNTIDTGLGDGNLRAGNWPDSPEHVGMILGTLCPQVGKFYFEITITFNSAGDSEGIGCAEYSYGATGAEGHSGAYTSNYGGLFFLQDGNRIIQDGTKSSWGAATATGSVVGFAMDCDNGALYVRDDGAAFMDSGDPASGASKTGALGTWTGGSAMMTPARMSVGGTGKSILNCGQHAFAASAPTGYKPLCTAHMTAPAITDPRAYFQSNQYTGTGSEHTITLTDAAGDAFAPTAVVLKTQNNSARDIWKVFDSARGATKAMDWLAASAETTEAQSLKSFTSTGYVLGTDDGVNQSSDVFSSFNWVEGSTPGFDVVAYTGDNTANRNISHGCGAAVDFAIIKGLGDTNWYTWHRAAFSATQFNRWNALIETTATNTPWGTSNFTSSQFMVTNNGTNNLNADGVGYVAWLWATVPGFSAFPAWAGNGVSTAAAGADGPFVPLGFRPTLWGAGEKTTQDDAHWMTSLMNPINGPTGIYLTPSTNNGVLTDAKADTDVLAQGIKIRGGGATRNEDNVIHYAYAWAEFPSGGEGVSQSKAR